MNAPMNSQTPGQRVGLAYFIGILGSFLIVAFLAWAIHRYTQPPPLGEDRVAVRTKALAELRAAEAEALHTTAWIDSTKGLVRLRVEDAMKLVEKEWQNPAAGRSNLIARVTKATAPPPPPPPSQFE
jgi:hypothetical protein